MNFSYSIKHSGIVVLSPNNFLIATSKENELNIYNSNDLKQSFQFNLNDPITRIEWSNDSKFILVGIFKKSYCEIKSIEHPNSTCTIDEGIAGMSYIRWSPDSRNVLSICDCNIKLTIWSLIDQGISFINNPKFADKGLAFSTTGFFMALGERKEWHDYIGIYYAKDWSLTQHFLLETIDMQEMLWLKDDSAIIVSDYAIESKVYFYSPEGLLMSIVAPNETINSIGINSMFLSSNGYFVAFSFIDLSYLKLYDCFTWKLITTLSNKTSSMVNSSIRAFKEEISNYEGKKSKYVESIFSIDLLTKSVSISNHNQGVVQLEWSFDEMYVAFKIDQFINVLWIWDLKKIELKVVIIQYKAIKDFKWSPTDNQLAIVSDSSKVYLFTLMQCHIYEIPLKENMCPNRIEWNENGTDILLIDKSSFILGSLQEMSIIEGFNSEFNN